jgi:twitching motility protein PilT
MEIALTAAETGHMVFSTLHTINAGQTINRIIGFFSKDEEDQVRYRLSDTIRYVVSQRLVPKVTGDRLLITEVIGNSLRTRVSIRYGESEGKTLADIIEAGTTYGWHSFDHCLLSAFQAGEVSEDTVLLYYSDKGKVRRGLNLAQKQRGAGDVKSESALKLEVKVAPAVPGPAEPGIQRHLSHLRLSAIAGSFDPKGKKFKI